MRERARQMVKPKGAWEGAVPTPRQDATGYDEPKADLPAEWGVSWDDLRRGKGGVVWEE
jgi:hypothetical protein